MKTEELKLDQTSLSINMETQKKQILCGQGKQAMNTCFKDTCNKSAFLCIDENCNCKQDHKDCILQSTLLCIQTIIQKKFKPLKQIIVSIQSQIQKSIDELSRFQEKLKKDLENSFMYAGFTQTENLVMNALRTGNVKQVEGKHIYEIIQQGLKKKTKYQYEIVEQKINECWQKYHEQFKTLAQFVNANLFNQNKVSLLKGSSIIKTYDDVQRITKFFNKKIQNTQLRFRAIVDSFAVSKFHQKCDNIPKTLTIIQTSTGKIFGGYTPCTWINNGGGYSADNSRESFIFQFNHNDKFTLKTDKTASAIWNYSMNGPTFGSLSDIQINNNSNINSSSFANIGNSYQNASYVFDDAISQAKFSGNKNFLVKDYEVWEITFA